MRVKGLGMDDARYLIASCCLQLSNSDYVLCQLEKSGNKTAPKRQAACTQLASPDWQQAGFASCLQRYSRTSSSTSVSAEGMN